jgi:hypothetical protein
MNATARGDVVSRHGALVGRAGALGAAGLTSAAAVSRRAPRKEPRCQSHHTQSAPLRVDFRRSVDDASGLKVKSAAGETAAEFEKRVQSLAGDSGFMLFKEIDQGDWLPV